MNDNAQQMADAVDEAREIFAWLNCFTPEAAKQLADINDKAQSSHVEMFGRPIAGLAEFTAYLRRIAEPQDPLPADVRAVLEMCANTDVWGKSLNHVLTERIKAAKGILDKYPKTKAQALDNEAAQLEALNRAENK